jgi:hypothetical protein
MSLDLPSLVPQIQTASATLAEEMRALGERLPQAEAALRTVSSVDPEELQAKLAKAGNRWPGAIPTADELAQSLAPPSLTTPLHILGADGSQIPPDRHAAALYYLINIGSLHYVAGSGTPPSTTTTPSLHAGRQALYQEDGGLIGPEIVHARRDIAEMAELARLAESCQGEPSLALLDNGLILWIALQVQGQQRKSADALLKDYLHGMTRVREAGAALAGVIDRPRHANVLALLHLLDLPLSSVDQDHLQATPYLGLTDRSLFARVLPEGHRSATFVYASPVNSDFKAAGHEVAFFYFRPPGVREPMRVEVPMWVANSPDLLARVHSGLVEQGAATGGFPYVLARAHELAVVSQAERQTVDGLFDQNLLDLGLTPEYSHKQIAKRWLSGRRRHHL